MIATYELGQALTTPYVTYSFASSEDEAYAALEAKKEELGDSLYKLNRRTLLKIVGRHTSYSTSQSLYEQTFSDVFGKYFKESQNDEEQIIQHCEGIAETFSAHYTGDQIPEVLTIWTRCCTIINERRAKK